MTGINKRSTQIDFSRLQRNISVPRNIPDTIIEKLFEEGDSHKNSKIDTKGLARKDLKEEDNDSKLKYLTLLGAARSGVRATKFVKEIFKSPSIAYQALYDIRLDSIDEYITIVRCKEPKSTALDRKGFLSLALAKKFIGPNIEDNICNVKTIQHINIISPLEIFYDNSICYTLFEYMAFSLYYINGSLLLDEIRLAVIIS